MTARRRKILLWSLWGSLGAIVVGGLIAVIGAFIVLNHYGRGLPDYRQLADYQPPVMTRIHAGDGSLLTEYARERRLFVPIEAFPRQLIHAVISAEDKNFFEHRGVDIPSIARAMIQNVGRLIEGRRPIGASTITQQVARGFLLTNEVSIERKIKEAILSFRMEKAFTKDRILELYLNQIYIGSGSYGMAAAALNYFDKSLDELTLGEMAFLAAAIKGPSIYHPVKNRAITIARRNWVLGEMADNGFISKDEADMARQDPLTLREPTDVPIFRADYFEEEVRRHLARLYGEDMLYEGGLSVRTTLEPEFQEIAEDALRKGLIAYDRRHGWRGPITRRSIEGDWAERLSKVPQPLGMDSWEKALVLELREGGAVIGFADRSFGFIPLTEMTWARPWREGEWLGPEVTDVADVLSVGDVIAVEPLDRDEPAVELATFFTEDGLPVGPVPGYGLRQIPAIEGAIVALDPHTGRVLAMVGGYNWRESQFNRATQAERQPGSAFKPFVYLAALEKGFTPSNLVLDAPFVIEQGAGQRKWKPRNYSNKFYGPSTLRLGIEKSRNLMTVRLAQHIGMDAVIDTASRFDVGERLEPTLAHALGAGEVTLLELTAAYGMLANGGKHVEPTLIDRIQNRRGKTIYLHDERRCQRCDAAEWRGQPPPEIIDDREQIVDPRLAYQMVSMLEGVIQRGTGRSIRSLGIPLAGKTGTSNDATDTWFVGFSPDLAVGVFVGFDRPRSLGNYEEGASAAAPVFKDFMGTALGDEPAIPFRIPPGIRLVRVDAGTGLPAQPGDDNVILEAFIPGTEPVPGELEVLDAPGKLVSNEELRKGTGGLY